MHNVLINGMTFSEYSKQAAATEPFDEALANRVDTLAEEVDELAERVVSCSKAIPTAYAQAVQRRSEALGTLADAREERRQRRLRTAKPRARFPALAKGEPLSVDLEAKSRSEDALRTVYTQLEQLRAVRMSPSHGRIYWSVHLQPKIRNGLFGGFGKCPLSSSIGLR